MRRPNARARRPAKRSILGRLVAKPGVIVAGAAFAAVMTGIVTNALLFQTHHHAAPLFGPAPVHRAMTAPTPPVITTPAAVSPEATAPMPMTRDAAARTPPAVVSPTPAATPTAKVVRQPNAPPVHKTAHPAPRKDSIGDLIARTQADR